jgi:hypothetical protein
MIIHVYIANRVYRSTAKAAFAASMANLGNLRAFKIY